MLPTELPSPWAGQLIVADWPGAPPPPERPIRFRTTFEVSGPLREAHLFITACGIYQAALNGRPIGDAILAPGWTSYRHRHRVAVHDITALVAGGRNVIGVTVAEGWYRGRLGWGAGSRGIYGDEIGPLVHLVLVDAAGREQVIATDRTWRASTGPILAASLYDGESVDLRLEEGGWSSPGFDDTGWAPVREEPFGTGRLFLAASPPVRRIETLAPAAITTSPSGRTLVDFGQNLSGRLRVRLPGAPGQQVSLRHAEVLEQGELGTRPLRGAKATDMVTLAGSPCTWEPAFTIHGFRYTEVSGWPGELRSGDIEAIVCHTDLEPIGTFSCSDPLLNRLHENVRWSAKGNFVDLPTDCPQRDERLGWTGDIQVFAPTAAFLFDCRTFLASWLEDLAAEQSELGTVPHFVPFLPLTLQAVPAAAWGDAAVVVPWVLYQRFGSLDVLRAQYDSMCAWVDDIAARAGGSHLWDRGFQFGDWLDPAAPPAIPEAARCDPTLVATAYHAHTAGIVAETARLFGRTDDAQRYSRLAADIRTAFQREFVSPSGRLASDAQTAYALALGFGLLTDGQRPRAAARLARLMRLDGYRIGTGFVGTPLILDALADNGYPDDAYHLLTQTECPSWLYPVTMGATTMWERWDSMLPDGSINAGEMTSFNHYAFGAVADFLHRRVAGLAPAAAGYATIAVRPLPGGGLTSAEASHRVAGGWARVRWQRDGGVFNLSVQIPAGHDATVELPDGSRPIAVTAGEHTFACAFRAAVDDPPRPSRPRFNLG
jgi:alpha-L-rhamnosidase